MKSYAPGKLVLLGEYAVLDGAPAIVIAVDRGVVCEFRPNDRLLIEVIGQDDRYVRPALEGIGALGHYRFDTYNRPDTATKAGLGGSASAVVAALYAGWTLQGRAPSPGELFALGHPVHRTVQGGGSGIDIAASAYGGTIRFQAGEVESLEPVLPSVIFSGRSAKTGPRIAQYLALGERQAFIADSTALALAFQADAVGTVREANRLLGSMAAAAGIEWMTPELEAICTLAEAHGGAAKPSGAGGGDCAVALVADRDAFEAACTAAGFTVIPTTLSKGAHLR